MSKYGAKKTTVAGIEFDSKAEARRYGELVILERAGYIKNLERQPVYILLPAVVVGGRKKPALRYKADFRYYDTKARETVVEDVKSPATAKLAAFRIKRHAMKHIHGIEVAVIA